MAADVGSELPISSKRNPSLPRIISEPPFRGETQYLWKWEVNSGLLPRLMGLRRVLR